MKFWEMMKSLEENNSLVGRSEDGKEVYYRENKLQIKEVVPYCLSPGSHVEYMNYLPDATELSSTRWKVEAK